jgi:hypothetical protein
LITTTVGISGFTIPDLTSGSNSNFKFSTNFFYSY